MNTVNRLYHQFEGEKYVFEQRWSESLIKKWDVLKVLFRCPAGFNYLLDLDMGRDQPKMLIITRINLRAHANKIIRDELQKVIAKTQEEITNLQTRIDAITPKERKPRTPEDQWWE